MGKVYITNAKRTPIGSFLGSLKDVSAGELGSYPIRALLEESGIDPLDIDEVIMGNVLPANQGQGLARQTAIRAGIPDTIPAYLINMACGSGMKAVMNAYTEIKAGDCHLVVAGGVESMSQAPYMISHKARTGNKMGNMELVDHMLQDGLTDAFHHYHMGVTAENVAARYQISREDQDAYAMESQRRAIEAVDSGAFREEIVPVEIKNRKETILFDADEYPNRKTSPEKLAALRPAFQKDGTVTAGNASGINDGASATLVVSEAYVQKHGLNPLVEIVAVGQGAVDPAYMGLGPTPAVKQALKRAGLSLRDMDIIELNEAFAAQSLGVIHELAEEFGLGEEEVKAKLNPNGGAIGLGHPIGASGNRILVTLIHQLKKRKLKYGLATLCIGGGMGTAVIVKNTDFEDE